MAAGVGCSEVLSSAFIYNLVLETPTLAENTGGTRDNGTSRDTPAIFFYDFSTLSRFLTAQCIV